jgi:hypothetical protein
MMGSLEKSLRYWHKAAKIRPNQEEVNHIEIIRD